MSVNEDFAAYMDPGIFVDELSGQVVTAPVGLTPTVLGLVGDTQRYRSATEIKQLTGTTPVALAKEGVIAASVVVRDRYTGVVYTVTTDYVVTGSPGADAVTGTLDDTYTINRAGTGAITDGSFVTITYNYTDPAYYQVQQYTDYDDVREAYGDPFDSSGSINSPVSLAAFLAFTNGASQVVVSPIQAAASTPTNAEWQAALDKFRDRGEVNVIVPVTGITAVHDMVRAHVDSMFDLGQYRRGFVGRNGAVSSSDFVTQASGYKDSRMVVVGPQAYQFYQSDTSTYITLGGEYAAVAVAALHTSLGVQVPLTRKRVQGFYSISTQLTNQQMIDLQRQGVLWVWQRRDGSLIIRHGLTTDMTSIYTREINIVAAKDRLMSLIFDTLDFQGLVGGVFVETTPQIVLGAVETALNLAMSVGLIQSYSTPKYRQPASNPTLFQVRFQYRPTLPLNYIQVQFSIDTSTGTASVQAGTTV